MEAESVSKIKYLKLWEVLSTETDEDHPMTTPELIKKLESFGIRCDRRTLYRNIQELNDNGYEILTKRTKSYDNAPCNGYYVEDRSFDVPEVVILMNAVEAASFITAKKTPSLVDKIANLAGSRRGEVLKRDIVRYGTVKGTNEHIYYSINEISQAIISKKKIEFNYFDWDVGNTRRYRMDPANPQERRKYVVNPLATVFHDDKYYLFCYGDSYGNVVQYRVDRMDSVKMLGEDIAQSDEMADFDLARHQRSLVGMFGGEPRTVKLVGTSATIDSVYDKLGTDVKARRIGEDKVEFIAEVQISKPFISWICGFGSALKITSPENVIEEVRRHLHEALANYE